MKSIVLFDNVNFVNGNGGIRISKGVKYIRVETLTNRSGEKNTEYLLPLELLNEVEDLINRYNAAETEEDKAMVAYWIDELCANKGECTSNATVR